MPSMTEVLSELDPFEKDMLQDVLDECESLSNMDTEEEIVATLEGEGIVDGEVAEDLARHIVQDLARKI